MNPYQVVRDFEQAIADYTGAKYVVAVNSCTMALFLCLKWFGKKELWWIDEHVKPEIEIPTRTYISVPMQIMHAGGKVAFRNEAWSGGYQLKPYPIWDYARRFTGGMYAGRQFQCVSFHASKILGIEQGGAILHDDEKADKWFRKARFDGRTEGVSPAADTFDALGWHCYLSPSVAAVGLLKLYSLPKDNPDLPNDDYPDLSKIELFR